MVAEVYDTGAKSATWISKKPFSISIIFIYGCVLAEDLGPHLSINKVTFNQEYENTEKDRVERNNKAVLQQNTEPVHKI